MRQQKLQQPPEAAEGAEAEEEAVVEVEEVQLGAALSQQQLKHPKPKTKAQSIRTCRQASGQGVIYTENGVGGHISVQSQPPAHGRMFSRHAHKNNETGTSPSVTLIS